MVKTSCKWLCVVILLLSLYGCSSNKGAPKALVVLGNSRESSNGDIEVAVKKWAAEKNVSLQIVTPKLATVYEQQKDLEQAIRKNRWDYIVLEPLGDDELYPILDYAKQRGSTIVSIQGSARLNADYTIQPCDYKELGKSMMDVFAEKTKQSGNYVTIIPATESEISIQAELACINRQKNNYQRMLPIKRLQEAGGAQKAYDVVDTLFNAQEMKGVLFFSYIDGIGISQWEQKTGNDLITVGIGNPEMIKKSVINEAVDALFYWNRKNLLIASLEVGYKAIGSSISNESDVIITDVNGYRTLHSLGKGVFFGNDILTTYNTTSQRSKE